MGSAVDDTIVSLKPESDTGNGLFVVKGVEIFSTGRHQKVEWTHKKLQQAVSNFHEYQLPGKVDKTPPVVLGHSEAQKLMHESGFPRVGSPTAMSYREVPCRLCNATGKAPEGVEAFDEHGSCPVCLGTKVQGIVDADLGQMPRTIARLVKGRAYSGVSAEVMEDRPPQVPGEGASFRRITLQGDRLPHIKTLADLPADYESMTEVVTPDVILRPLWCVQESGGAWECFSEVSKVEEFAEGKPGPDWAKKLLSYGHKASTLEKMDETAGKEMAEMHDKLAMPKYEHGDRSDDDWQAHEPRSEAVEKYGEMCAEKHNHMKMRGKRLFGEEHFAEVDAVAERFSEEQLAQITQAVVAKIGSQVGPLEKRVKDFEVATEAKTKRARVEAFAERMKLAGKIQPHEQDETARAANPRFRTLTERLMAMDDTVVVERFSEGGKEVTLTQLGMEMEAIKARPSQSYGSKTRGATESGGPDMDLAKVELHYAAHAEKFAEYNTSKEEFVGGFIANRKYDPKITAEQYLNPVAGRR